MATHAKPFAAYSEPVVEFGAFRVIHVRSNTVRLVTLPSPSGSTHGYVEGVGHPDYLTTVIITFVTTVVRSAPRPK